MIFSKRAQSQVISTVLLILLVIASITIVMGLVIPFIKNQLSSTNCFDVINEVSIENNIQYTCYDVESKAMSIQVHIGDNDNLGGFAIELGGASSKSYEIRDKLVSEDIKMFKGNYNESLELPGKNEERTYLVKVSEKPDSVKIYPILEDDKICDSSDSLNKIASCK